MYCVLCIVYCVLCISEFDSYKPLFLAMNNKKEKKYCDFNGRIFSFVNN